MGNNKIWISLLALVFLLSGCGGEAAGGAPQKSAPEAGPVSFVAGMGCTDPNCTDPGHHHDCPVDCADYEHHHNCALDCAEPSHNHKDHHEEPHHTAAVEPAPSVEPQPEPAPEPEPVPAPQPEPPAVQTQTLTAVSYISGMGCSDPNCTDPSHYHDCPADCANYEHYHHCALNCAETGHHHANHHSETSTAVPVSFVAGMGCSDPNCTDPSHYHDCPAGCADYEHYHSCALNCAEAGHHHANHHSETSTAVPVSFVAGMGCSDPNCTDPNHYHDCPADCANYEHRHSCALDCAEPSHCHASTAVSTGGGRHHGGGHHGRHH